jgi:hypothetical protein
MATVVRAARARRADGQTSAGEGHANGRCGRSATRSRFAAGAFVPNSKRALGGALWRHASLGMMQIRLRMRIGEDITTSDFFISYTRADRAWAEWIAWHLEAKGYTAIFQSWDFIPGRDWVHEMQTAAATARRTIAVLSDDYLSSVHGEAEWRAAYANDPTGERALLVPVRVAECDPPGLLKTRVFIDLAGLEEDAAQTALLAGVEQRRAKPTLQPAFPQRESPRYPGLDAPAPAPSAPIPRPTTPPIHAPRSYRVADLFSSDPVTMVAAAGAVARSAALTWPPLSMTAERAGSWPPRVMCSVTTQRTLPRSCCGGSRPPASRDRRGLLPDTPRSC